MAIGRTKNGVDTTRRSGPSLLHVARRNRSVLYALGARDGRDQGIGVLAHGLLQEAELEHERNFGAAGAGRGASPLGLLVQPLDNRSLQLIDGGSG